jgi:hypothetical protein
MRARDTSRALEKLDGALVLFRGRASGERPEIAAFSCLGILLPRIQAIFTGREFSDHLVTASMFASRTITHALACFRRIDSV